MLPGRVYAVAVNFKFVTAKHFILLEWREWQRVWSVLAVVRLSHGVIALRNRPNVGQVLRDWNIQTETMARVPLADKFPVRIEEVAG